MSRFGIIFVSLIIFLTGCTHTEYKPYEDVDGLSSHFTRTVHFTLNPDLEESPPNCVVVFKLNPNRYSVFMAQMERVLLRHLSERFFRIVGGEERDLKAAKLAFDLTLPIDRKNLSGNLGCDSFMEFHVLQPNHTYLFVWSKLEIGLEARLYRQADGVELWRARHVANRSDGGFSISPIGLAVSAYKANDLSLDRDAIESISDDLVRRVLSSLPGI